MSKKLTVKDFKEVDSMYYVGDVFEVDGDGWVSGDELKEMLKEQDVPETSYDEIETMLTQFLWVNEDDGLDL